MSTRSIRYGAEEHLLDLDYFIAHLKADPQTEQLVPDVEPVYGGLRGQMDDWAAKTRELIEAQTAVANADAALDEAVRNAQAAVLEDVHHSRSDPKYVTWFPRGLGAVVKAAYLDEAVAVAALADLCAQDPSAKLRAQAEPLVTAVTRMRLALDRRSEVQRLETVSYGQLQVQKLNAIDTIRRVCHRLSEIFPRDPEKVRSFTRPMNGRNHSKQTPAPQPVPETQG